MTEQDKPQRRIRSFVRREGRLTDSQKQALEQHWQQYGLNLGDGQVEPASVFGREAHVTLEIGFGNGASLFTQAQKNPGQDYIGVEVYKTGVARLFRSTSDAGLTNVRAYCEDAIEVIDQCLPDASFDCVQLYFPDPWHKKRHHKRRIVQTAFADKIARIVKPGGIWFLATDWENYAEHMVEVLNPHPLFSNLSESGDFIPRPDERPQTRFEDRGIKRGHGVWDMAYRRND